METQSISLTEKYNTPGPRYTSYPTVPYWEENLFTQEKWKMSVQTANLEEGVSLYIHLPYCENLCTFCGCNKRITKNHAVESPYIDALLKEWQMYLELLGEKPTIKEIHLGGGTPTFFSPEALKRLILGIMINSLRHLEAEFSFEGHPNNTTKEHLQTLFDLGFRRVSYGIQCFDPVVQKAINRVQSFEQVQNVTELSRSIGYTSVNFDVIYGLPFQTLVSVEDTFAKLASLKPDRVAYYSYAHVPWIKGNGQRKFTDADLPAADQKLAMYALGKELLLEIGYETIGMDHFSLPTDQLYKSAVQGELHRNFMGYTSGKTELMIGLGVSSISDAWGAFAQNLKTVEDYLASIEENKLPVFRGHILSAEDKTIRKHILELMCQFETKLPAQEELKWEVMDRLSEPLRDNLAAIIDNKLVITDAGKSFLRNICLAFDLRLWKNKPDTQLFSMMV